MIFNVMGMVNGGNDSGSEIILSHQRKGRFTVL